MYRNLKFSWAHILLFLAIIFIGYVTYVGITYKLDKGLTEPLWYTLGIVVLLLFWFFGVQQHYCPIKKGNSIFETVEL